MNNLTLDGKYQVTSTSSYDGPLERRSDGITEIRDGKTVRLDENKVLWTSTFKILNEDEAEMTSIADPSKAKVGFALTQPNGAPTRAPVTYTSTLKIARKGDKLQLSGQISYGNEIIFVTLRKIGD